MELLLIYAVGCTFYGPVLLGMDLLDGGWGSSIVGTLGGLMFSVIGVCCWILIAICYLFHL